MVRKTMENLNVNRITKKKEKEEGRMCITKIHKIKKIICNV